jgi:hypothetical protein
MTEPSSLAQIAGALPSRGRGTRPTVGTKAFNSRKKAQKAQKKEEWRRFRVGCFF